MKKLIHNIWPYWELCTNVSRFFSSQENLQNKYRFDMKEDESKFRHFYSEMKKKVVQEYTYVWQDSIEITKFEKVTLNLE